AVIDESMGDEVRITVIATGFGAAVDARMRPVVVESRSAPSVPPPVAAAPDGRPVRRHGLVVEDELDVPTWQRRRQEPPVAAARVAGPRPVPKAVVEDEGADEDYDIPTFLRRGATE
ncbi:MAG TPA: hypothetical protein VFD84_13870, partial [Candidatus Binatia bacterium]|nr:hypothetical protein [Candidatus Binatia bacterium]